MLIAELQNNESLSFCRIGKKMRVWDVFRSLNLKSWRTPSSSLMPLPLAWDYIRTRCQVQSSFILLILHCSGRFIGCSTFTAIKVTSFGTENLFGTVFCTLTEINSLSLLELWLAILCLFWILVTHRLGSISRRNQCTKSVLLKGVHIATLLAIK